MAGKGQRRREKNYKAAHGQGNTRLPPPPVLSSIDAVPSKLRKLMSLGGARRQPFNQGKGNGIDKGVNLGEGMNSNTSGMKRKRSDQSSDAQVENQDGVTQTSVSKKKKNTRKKNKAEDLRFEAVGEQAPGSKRRERKKQFMLARKKKHEKNKSDDDMDFPGHEEIRFGEVVLAPPKLTYNPKTSKTTHDASQERVRLQAVDAYRQRKGWASRPGVKLPPPMTTSPF